MVDWGKPLQWDYVKLMTNKQARKQFNYCLLCNQLFSFQFELSLEIKGGYSGRDHGGGTRQVVCLS